MRVSKAVKDYIAKRVEEKLMPRYQEHKEQAEYEVYTRNEILNRASKMAQDVFSKTVKEMASKYPFLEVNMQYIPNCFSYDALTIPDRIYISSVHKWQDRMRKERDEIVQNIVVELELGGTKADLERLLSEI